MALRILIYLLAGIAVAACNRPGSMTHEAGDDDTLLSITDRDGYCEVVVRDPWSPVDTLAHYALVEHGADVAVPAGLTVVEVPLTRAVVYSTVHTAALDELGVGDIVKGVADTGYLTPDDPLYGRVKSGEVADIGSSMAPTVEIIIEQNPDAIILSPMQGGIPAAITALGVPVIYMADYMEGTPLTRAGWIRLLGALTGQPARADSIFEAVSDEYNMLAAQARACSDRPQVIVERPYNGVWYVPGGASYKARMLADAGAEYPWSATDTSTGSLQLNEEGVIARGAGARYWLLNESAEITPEALVAAVPHAKGLRAFPSGVYYTNTVEAPMYRDLAFHPERVLRDMIYIFHPELRGDAPLRYYKPVAK